MFFQLSKKLYYVGVNDRHKHLFENMLPLPHGVTYNSYLLVDDKVALIDTVDAPFAGQLYDNLHQILGDRKIDYLIVNHMEPDHSSGITLLKKLNPDMQIVGNVRTMDMLKGYYGIDDGLYVVEDGGELSLGSLHLRFFFTPMVHWPEVMMTYCEEEKTLFSADAFGTFGTLDGAVLDTDLAIEKFIPEIYRYYVNIVGKYGAPVQASFKKLSAVQLDRICSTHGPIWTTHKDIVVDIYDRMSRYEGEEGVCIIYGSMYGHTEQMAELVAVGAAQVTKNVVLYDVSKHDHSLIVSDAFRYKGLIMGGPTYCNKEFPFLQDVMDKLEIRTLKNRIFGAFGSYSWAGTSVRDLNKYARKQNWETLGSVEVKYTTKEEDNRQLIELGRTVAQKVLDSFK